MITAGELRELIKFLSPLRADNGSGGFNTTYSEYLSTYAAVVEESSKPQIIAGQEDIINYVHFKIRYRPDVGIKNGDRLTWRGFNFTVNNIKVSGLRTKIDIFCNSEIETSER